MPKRSEAETALRGMVFNPRRDIRSSISDDGYLQMAVSLKNGKRYGVSGPIDGDLRTVRAKVAERLLAWTQEGADHA